MKTVAAARAAVVLDFDDRLHARQMLWQRAAVCPPLRGALPAFGRISTFGLFLAGRLDLLGLLEPEKQLVFGQALGTAAEAVALQLFDDLAQPLVLGSRASTIAFSPNGGSGSWSVASP